MGCGGSKDKPAEGENSIEHAGEAEENPGATKATVVSSEPKEDNPGQPSSFDGLVMCTLAALLRLCDQVDAKKCQELVGLSNKLLDIITGANCPKAWEVYLDKRSVRDATFEIIQTLSRQLSTNPTAALKQTKRAIEKHEHVFESRNSAGMKIDTPIAPLQEIMDILAMENDIEKMDPDDVAKLRRMVQLHIALCS